MKIAYHAWVTVGGCFEICRILDSVFDDRLRVHEKVVDHYASIVITDISEFDVRMRI